jgi:molybdopterin-guanine dinucleotide biosynthesis protein B
MRTVGIVGFKKSGKTALTALVAESLERRRLTVGIIKFSHHSLDKQNTDTFWLMRPGRVVAGCCPDEAAIFWSRPVPAKELAAFMDVDVLLVEGGKRYGDWPRILCLRETKEALQLRSPDGEEGGSVLATVGAEPDESMGPHFAGVSPETADALAALILERGMLLERGQEPVASPEHDGKTVAAAAQSAPECSCSDPDGPMGKGSECPCERATAKGGVSVTIGGRRLDMHKFVENMVSGVILGMMRELKGYVPGEDIVIRLRGEE